ncbi:MULTISPECIES: hypothetical protein [unclassified Xanthomonas]|uniref:hypothetical protein n=1 Tax=Xanthomonas sp. LMG 9002 TaxID=1591158 RepID=UPI00136A9905|nr:hypothetical protein [Xanthomonas sp. LMG 9002]MXV08913.1 hypothetical protein [Xanthomonas sp. LMG 9002]
MGPLLLALLPLAVHAAPDVPDSLRVSSTSTYAPGTPEWRQVRDWLAQHRPSQAGPAQTQNLEQLGPLMLAYARALHSVPTQAPEPLPLPDRGSAGDSIAIASCIGGVRQSWLYSVETRPAGAWVLMSFATSQTADCKQADSTH